jgi:hypothetical protein
MLVGSTARADTWTSGTGTIFSQPATRVGVGNTGPSSQLDVLANTSGRLAIRVNQQQSNVSVAEFQKSGAIQVSIDSAGTVRANKGVVSITSTPGQTAIIGTNSVSGDGIQGNGASVANGVVGTSSGTGNGVLGASGLGSGSGVSFLSRQYAGVVGLSNRGSGIYGAVTGPNFGDVNQGGVLGYSSQQASNGIIGIYQGGDNQVAGVKGIAIGPGGALDFSSASFGVLGISGSTGVFGDGVGFGTGVWGRSLSGNGVTGQTTSGTGLLGTVDASSSGNAIYGDAGGSFTAWAGNFNGDVAGRDFFGNSFNPSDARLKRDIKDAPYGLKDVLRLRPVTYQWKDPARHG